MKIFGVIVWLGAFALMGQLSGSKLAMFINIPALLFVALGVAGALMIAGAKQQTRAGRLHVAATAAWYSGIIAFTMALIVLLGNISDPQAIGPNTAVALTAVLYGAIISMVCKVLSKVSE